MSTNLFKITPTPPTTIQIAPGEAGKFSFTVESLAAPDKVHEIILQALLIGPDGKGQEVKWLEVGSTQPLGVASGKQTLSMSGGKTETISITVRPPPEIRGAQTIKLVIADKDRPNDIYAEAPTVAFEVPDERGPHAPPKKFPWWVIALIAGGAVLLVGGGLLIWKLSSGGGGPAGLGEPCSASDAPACDEGLICVPGAGRCLLLGGAKCQPTQGAQCASGECEGKLAVCTVPIGAACEPGDKDVVPCRTGSVCNPAAKRCLGTVGAKCKADAECETSKCTEGVCVTTAPAVQPGDPCEGTCPAPLSCSPTAKRCVEQIGRPCSNNNQCSTGLCEGTVCTKPELLRNCTQDGICDLDQKCVDVQPGLKRCRWQPGHACASSGECSSMWGCNRGTCARDDGKCADQSDCPSPYTCIAAKQTCLKLRGLSCGGAAECESGFCRDNRCDDSPCNPPCTGVFRCNNNPQAPKCIRLFGQDVFDFQNVIIPRGLPVLPK